MCGNLLPNLFGNVASVKALLEDCFKRDALNKSMFTLQVKLFCYECNENICVLCFAVKHRHHSSAEIAEVAPTLRPTIDDDDRKILAGVSAVRQQSERVKLDVKMCVGQVDSVENLILEAGDAAKRFVDDQINEYLVKLHAVKSECVKRAEVVQVDVLNFREIFPARNSYGNFR